MKKIVCMLSLIFLCGVAEGYEIAAGRYLGMGRTVILSEPSATDALLSSTPGVESGRLLIESGYHNRYDLPELDLSFLALGYRYGDLAASFGASQFGRSDYYSEKIWKAAVGYCFGVVSLGFHAGGKSVAFGDDYGSFSAVSYGAAIGAGYREYRIAIVGDNLNEPALAENVEPDPAVWNIYLEAKNPKAFSVTGRMTIEKDRKPSMALGQYFRLLKKSALFWGLSGNPLAYGGGVEIARSGLILNYSANYHPTLGLSHCVSLGFSWKR
jgi:hypothetical protein